MAEKIVPFLRAADAHASAARYARLGFTVAGEQIFGEGMPVFPHLSRGDVDVHPSEHGEDAPEGGLVDLWVEDIRTVAAEFDARVFEAPWARVADPTDPDGNRPRLGQRLPDAA